jgi:hypothetical protein
VPELAAGEGLKPLVNYFKSRPGLLGEAARMRERMNDPARACQTHDQKRDLFTPFHQFPPRTQVAL